MDQYYKVHDHLPEQDPDTISLHSGMHLIQTVLGAAKKGKTPKEKAEHVVHAVAKAGMKHITPELKKRIREQFQRNVRGQGQEDGQVAEDGAKDAAKDGAEA